jgi:transcription-repair coupling factor (superfamily II helicase)
MDFLIAAHIPQGYVEAEDIRVIFYRKLAAASNPDDVKKVRDELKDRFGTPPEPVENLLKLTEVKLLAERRKIKSILEDEKYINIYFSKDGPLTQEAILDLANRFKNQIEFMRGENFGLRIIKNTVSGSIFIFIKELVVAIE